MLFFSSEHVLNPLEPICLAIPILPLLKTLVINLTHFSSSSLGSQNQQLDSKLTQLKIFCRNFSQNQAPLDVITNPE
jgi:hypothetical protein